MATLTVQSLFQLAGTSSATTLFFSKGELMTTSSSNGDKFLNTGREVLLVMNSSSQGGASVTVGVTAQAVDNYGGAAALHSLSGSVASSSFGLLMLGPFQPSLYNDANGFVNVTYSAGGMLVGVVSVAPRS